MRVVSPPLETIPADAVDPLTTAVRLLDGLLPEEWEIYWRPHLNGLRPDIVLLHPQVGVAVVRVLHTSIVEDATTALSRLRGEQEQIATLYCPRLGRASGITDVQGLLLCTAMSGRQSRALAVNRESRSGSNLTILGAEELDEAGLRKATWLYEQERDFVSEAVVRDLRHWLVEPDVAQSMRSPLPVDEDRRRLIMARTTTGYRRVRGPAGSGKSLVLAARASQLIAEDSRRRVLVVSYNITLLHYLMTLADRWPHPGASTRANISWFSFHRWCRSVCEQAGRLEDYRAVWRHIAPDDDVFDDDSDGTVGNERDEILSERLPALVSRILVEEPAQVEMYDAVLIDEGQDFHPSWWDVLRKVCVPGGEMLLTADFAQDVYGTAGGWTESAMVGAGFSGPWVTLNGSYRLPSDVAELASEYARRFLKAEAHETPRPAQLQIPTLGTKLRWVQVPASMAAEACVDEILSAMPNAEPRQMSFSDVTFLTSGKEVGKKVVAGLRQKELTVVHTFGRTESESRRLKQAFVMDSASVKATTIHSFKGWESRVIVAYIGQANTHKGRALLFSAMTRVKYHPAGNYLAIICADRSLCEFGRRWPEFKDRQIAERLRRAR